MLFSLNKKKYGHFHYHTQNCKLLITLSQAWKGKSFFSSSCINSKTTKSRNTGRKLVTEAGARRNRGHEIQELRIRLKAGIPSLSALAHSMRSTDSR